MASARQREADRASLAFSVALSQIGQATVGDALDLWQEVPPARRAPTTGSWLRRVIRLVLFRRRQSRELARAYYRYVRALQTGTTIQDPAEPKATETTLTALRDEFEQRVHVAASQVASPQEGQTTAPPDSTTPEPEAPASEPPANADDDSEADELDRILIEEIERLKEDEARIEADAERELQVVLDALGPKNLDRKLDDIDLHDSAENVDRLRDEAHTEAGLRQASAAGRVAMNGGRSTLWSLSGKDKRVLGYVRLSRTGTPCGWCAMLISRGPVYKSEASAEYSDGDQYHDNCNCYAMPVWSREQYEESDLFALNREYHELWPKVTRGLGGKSAVSAWRRYFRQQQASKRAQEARSPNNVQEA